MLGGKYEGYNEPLEHDSLNKVPGLEWHDGGCVRCVGNQYTSNALKEEGIALKESIQTKRHDGSTEELEHRGPNFIDVYDPENQAQGLSNKNEILAKLIEMRQVNANSFRAYRVTNGLHDDWTKTIDEDNTIGVDEKRLEFYLKKDPAQIPQKVAQWMQEQIGKEYANWEYFE